ncbi:hypothetical protein SAY86_014085 [Trapa natans]|uniref:Uncharacterized protein n=1 Tax=Trapa natans TaxID=22666 RepID=A0AAN7QR24_TRANT|nr:hypothetical protein SAY86_014085 [Trapa natans]
MFVHHLPYLLACGSIESVRGHIKLKDYSSKQIYMHITRCLNRNKTELLRRLNQNRQTKKRNQSEEDLPEKRSELRNSKFNYKNTEKAAQMERRSLDRCTCLGDATPRGSRIQSTS